MVCVTGPVPGAKRTFEWRACECSGWGDFEAEIGSSHQRMKLEKPFSQCDSAPLSKLGFQQQRAEIAIGNYPNLAKGSLRATLGHRQDDVARQRHNEQFPFPVAFIEVAKVRTRSRCDGID